MPTLRRLAARMPVFVLWLAAFSLAAQQAPDPTKPPPAFEPPSGPGPGQAYLKTFEGEWDVEKIFYPASGTPVKSTGECSQKMVQDGRFLESRFTFHQDGKTSTGVGVSGFDTRSGMFTTVWYDSRQTRMSIRKSRDPFDGKQIVLYGVSLEAEPSRGGRESKTVSHLEDGGRKLIHQQFNTGADGKERLLMELLLTRKK